MKKIISIFLLSLLIVSSLFAGSYRLTGNFGCKGKVNKIFIITSTGIENQLNDKEIVYAKFNTEINPDLFSNRKFSLTDYSTDFGLLYCFPKEWPVELHLGGGVFFDLNDQTILQYGPEIRIDAFGPINEKWSCGLTAEASVVYKALKDSNGTNKTTLILENAIKGYTDIKTFLKAALFEYTISVAVRYAL